MNSPSSLFRPALALALAGGLFAAGVAQAQSASAERRLSALGYVKAEAVDVVPDQVITSWNYLDSQNVLVHRDTARHYLVTLTYPCPALETASLISFNAAIAGLGSSQTLSVGSRNSATDCTLGPIYRLDRQTRSF